MRIQLSDHFTYRRLLRFVFPSVVMMIFTSLSEIVDGFFVSNFVGKTPFAALNLIWPFYGMLGSIGFMFATGGSALVARTLGEGDAPRARRYFSLIVYTAIAIGILLAVIGFAAVPAAAVFLGAEGEMLAGCIEYGRVLMFSLPFFILAYIFQSFFVTAERPKLGLAVMLTAGFTNMALDVIFIALLDLGLSGAAGATTLAQTVGGVLPLIYFTQVRRRAAAGSSGGADSGTVGSESAFGEAGPGVSGGSVCLAAAPKLYLTKTRFEPKVLLRSCYNGLSELATCVSMSLVSMLYNTQLLKLAGENGVAAYGVIMYVDMIFVAIFQGYSVGTAPIVSYHYGADHHAELNNMLKKSLVIIGVSGVCMTAAAALLAKPLGLLFVGYDAELLSLTVRAFRIFSIAYLLIGFNIYSSSFFTALNNGAVSAAISFARAFVFQVAAVLLLPLLFGIDGIWLAITAAEILALMVTIFFFMKMRGRYHYA